MSEIKRYIEDNDLYPIEEELEESMKREKQLKIELELSNSLLQDADEHINCLQDRIDKAIKHIETHQLCYQSQYEEMSGFDNHLLDILRGNDEENKE